MKALRNAGQLMQCLAFIALANVLYFLWQTAPKALWPPSTNLPRVLDFITNLIFLIFYFIMLVKIVRQTEGSYSDKSKDQGETSVIVILLLLTQLSADILRLVAVKSLHWHIFIVDDVCTFLSVLLFAIIFWERTVKRNWNEAKKKDIALAICVCLMLVVFAVVLASDIKSMGQLSVASQKYVENSTKLVYLEKNTIFCHGAKNLTLDFLITAIPLTYLYFKAEFDSEETPRVKTWGLLVTRIFLAVCAVLILWGAKALLLPDSGISSLWNATGESECTKAGFYVNYKNKILYRGSDPTKEAVYSVSRGTVWMRNQRVASISVDGNYSAAFATGHNTLNDEWMSVNIQGKDVEIFANQLITYGTRKAYTFYLKDLKSAKIDYTLICLCEEMVKAGNWDFFEYGYEYLQQYDPDFINPYIQRYAAGNFTEEELSANEDINPAYIADISARALEEAKS